MSFQRPHGLGGEIGLHGIVQRSHVKAGPTKQGVNSSAGNRMRSSRLRRRSLVIVLQLSQRGLQPSTCNVTQQPACQYFLWRPKGDETIMEHERSKTTAAVDCGGRVPFVAPRCDRA